MSLSTESARARAEAMFKTPTQGDAGPSPADQEAAALRAKTERLRAARLAQEAMKHKGVEIRRERRRGA